MPARYIIIGESIFECTYSFAGACYIDPFGFAVSFWESYATRHEAIAVIAIRAHARKRVPF